jgi:hypothetical protein
MDAQTDPLMESQRDFYFRKRAMEFIEADILWFVRDVHRVALETGAGPEVGCILYALCCFILKTVVGQYVIGVTD